MKSGTVMGILGDHVGVPPGWSSEAFVNQYGMIVIRVGSYLFPQATNDDVGQTARAAMGPNDVLVNIVDVTATEPDNPVYLSRPGPVAIDASQAIQQQDFSSPAAIIAPVRIDGRNFYVSVSFGSAPPSSGQVSAANAVLATLGAS